MGVGREQLKDEQLEEAYNQLGEAHEIDVRVANGELTTDDVARLRKYQRDE